MVPFETFFTKKSCFDVVEEAREYLNDVSLNVAKTPAGFNRARLDHLAVKRRMNQKTSPDQDVTSNG